MLIKPSAVLRNDYNQISNLVKETSEPIYITKNGEGDMVVMNIEAFHRREKLLDLKEKLLIAEEQRIKGEKNYSLEEVKDRLQEKIKTVCSQIT